MKNNFAFVIFSAIVFIFSSYSNAFAQAVFEYIDVKEPLTSKVVLQTILPKNVETKLNAKFSDNYQNPLFFDFFANIDDEKFYYSSPEVFVTTLKKRKLTAFKSNFFKDYPEKSFKNIDEYLLQLFPENAQNVKKVREYSFSEDVKGYLNANWFEYLKDIGYKADAGSVKTILEKAEVIPFARIYSYILNGENFEKLIAGNIETADIMSVYGTVANQPDTEVKKLVRVKGIYSCDYLSKNRNKAFDDFIVFASNTNVPFRVVNALEAVTKQKYMNDKLTDEEKLPGTPSELFVRFYENELPVTSEKIHPDNVFIIKAVNELSNYRYGSIFKLFQKNIFVPQKYSYVYLKKGKTFTLAEEKTKKAGKKLRKNN